MWSSYDFLIGNSEGTIYPFSGEMQDIRVHNNALSTQEIKDYHNNFANQIYYKNAVKTAVIGGPPTICVAF